MAASALLPFAGVLVAFAGLAAGQPACSGSTTYALGGASTSCCPAPGTTFLSSSLGCAPATSGPSDTVFALSGLSAEGLGGFAAAGATAAPTYGSGLLGANGALVFGAGAYVDASGAALQAALPVANAAVSAAAWVNCPASTAAPADVVSFGTASATISGGSSPRFALSVTGTAAGTLVQDSGTGPTLLNANVRTVAGISGNVDGPASSATFNGPYGVAYDATNSWLYVLDTSNNLVRQINVITNMVLTMAGTTGKVAGFSDGVGSTAQFSGPRHGVVGPDGALWIADTGNQRVRRMMPGLGAFSGNVTTVSGSGTASTVDGTATSASHNGPAALAFDSAGTLYCADYNGNVLRKITVPGYVVSTIVGTGTGGYLDGVGLAATLYGSTGITYFGNALYLAEYQYSRVRKVDLASSPLYNVTTVTGSSYNLLYTSTSLQSQDGTLQTAMLAETWAITNDNQGNLYVTQYGWNNVRKISIANNAVTTFAGPSNCTSVAVCVAGVADGSGGQSDRFHYLRGIVFDGSTTLYVPEQDNNRITALALPTGAESTVAGLTFDANVSTAVADYAGLQDGPTTPSQTAALLNAPRQAVVDTLGSGNLYFVDEGNSALRVLTPAGVVTTLAGGVAGPSAPPSIDGQGTAAQFYEPSGITQDSAGNLYISEPLSTSRIRKATFSAGVWTVTTFAGNGTAGNSNGIGTAARFHSPYHLGYIASQNAIFAAEYDNNLIRRISLIDASTTTYAGGGTGSTSAGYTDGVGTLASFNGPHGLTTDTAGNVYVACLLGNQIRKIAPGGVVTTLAGQGSTTAGTANGVGTLAGFTYPRGMAYDPSGFLYIAETTNNRVRKLDLATNAVTVLAGTLITSSSSTSAVWDGAATAARFNGLYSVAFDQASGSLYVLDTGNHVIRAVEMRPNAIPACDGTWHHVALTHGDGAPNALKAYVDGRLVAFDSQVFSTTATNVHVGWSGALTAAGGELFGATGGRVADVRLYKRALASSEVLAIANTPWPSVTGAVATSNAANTSYTYSCAAGSTGLSITYTKNADGSWTPVGSASGTCTACNAGSFAALGAASCQLCAANSYAPAAGTASCLPCSTLGAGFTSASGATTCAAPSFTATSSATASATATSTMTLTSSSTASATATSTMTSTSSGSSSSTSSSTATTTATPSSTPSLTPSPTSAPDILLTYSFSIVPTGLVSISTLTLAAITSSSPIANVIDSGFASLLTGPLLTVLITSVKVVNVTDIATGMMSAPLLGRRLGASGPAPGSGGYLFTIVVNFGKVLLETNAVAMQNTLAALTPNSHVFISIISAIGTVSGLAPATLAAVPGPQATLVNAPYILAGPQAVSSSSSTAVAAGAAGGGVAAAIVVILVAIWFAYSYQKYGALPCCRDYARERREAAEAKLRAAEAAEMLKEMGLNPVGAGGDAAVGGALVIRNLVSEREKAAKENAALKNLLAEQVQRAAAEGGVRLSARVAAPAKRQSFAAQGV